MIEPQEGQTGYDIREVYDDETGVLRMRQIRLNGKLYSPPSDEPSHAAYDKAGTPLLFKWHKGDLDHRDSGPSAIWFCPKTGKPKVEIFEINGCPRSNALGPHIVHRDPISGEIIEISMAEDWCEKNHQNIA